MAPGGSDPPGTTSVGLAKWVDGLRGSPVPVPVTLVGASPSRSKGNSPLFRTHLSALIGQVPDTNLNHDTATAVQALLPIREESHSQGVHYYRRLVSILPFMGTRQCSVQYALD